MRLPRFRLRPDRGSGRPSTRPLPRVFSIAAALSILLGTLLPSSGDSFGTTTGLPRAISRATTPFAFDLVGWEVTALAQGIVRRLQIRPVVAALGEDERRSRVLEYTSAVAERNRLRGEEVATRVGGKAAPVSYGGIEARLAEADGRLAQLASIVTEVIGQQVADYLTADGTLGPIVDARWRAAIPPLSLEINPPVFFRFEEMPLLLVVAPRGRVAVLQSVFLHAGLSLDERERIEDHIDREGTSSVVTTIGGFAAYPSMVPHSTSLPWTLQVVAHEWVHQYLAMRPLGRLYFSSYGLRAINETVADIVGTEVGEALHREVYAPHLSPGDGAREAKAATDFNFVQAMAEIRQVVEQMLERGDVSGAERYMAERKAWLADHGYYLRKLNTAYLTFYGAYSGSGNKYEPKLRLLRDQAGSLAEFLRRVSEVSSEADLDRLTGG